MTRANNRLLDEFAKLAADAAAVAQGMRREVETAVKSQAERFLGDMDIVNREDHRGWSRRWPRAPAPRTRLRGVVTRLEARVAALEGRSSARPAGAETRRPPLPSPRPERAPAPGVSRARGTTRILLAAISSGRLYFQIDRKFAPPRRPSA